MSLRCTKYGFIHLEVVDGGFTSSSESESDSDGPCTPGSSFDPRFPQATRLMPDIPLSDPWKGPVYLLRRAIRRWRAS